MADQRASYLTSKFLFLFVDILNPLQIYSDKDPHELWVDSPGKVYMLSKVADARTVPNKKVK